MDQNKLMQIFGAEELVSMFEDLSIQLQNRILQSSFKEAAKIIISEAQGNLGGRYSHVSNSFTTTMKRDIQTLNVGASKKKGGYLAHIANSGTKERGYTTKLGNYHKTGKITPNYFWDNALVASETQVEEVIYKEVKDQFDKMISKNKTGK